MKNESTSGSPFFQVDVNSSNNGAPQSGATSELTELLTQLVEGQDRQNELLQELVDQSRQSQQQRAKELRKWRTANPRLAKSCQQAAETLSRVQTEFLASIAQEVEDNQETLLDGGFMMTEFVDRFGPRLAHLNGVLQVLSQLGHSDSK